MREIILALCGIFMLTSGFLLYEHQRELTALRTQVEVQQRQIKASAMRVDRNEYVLGELGYNQEQLADEIVSRCMTREPRAAVKLRGR